MSEDSKEKIIQAINEVLPLLSKEDLRKIYICVVTLRDL